MEKPIFTKDKKLKIIYLSIVMGLLLLSCIFHGTINPFIKNKLKDDFSLVTNHNSMLIHFIDVGQGDAIAVNFPDGKVALIDCGSANTSVDYCNYIKENVINTKINPKIDYLILTHADSDHIGGALKILNNFEIETIFMPKNNSNSDIFEKLNNIINKNNKINILGEEMIIKNNNYEILFFEIMDNKDNNKSSQIIKIKYKNKSFLFMADAEIETEKYLINNYLEELNCDILKVAHHGSKSSTCEEFLEIVTPEISVISVGENSYGHPHDEVIARLENINSEIITTNDLGNIMFVLGDGYEMDYLNGNYVITSLTLRYEIFVIVLELLISMYLMWIILYHKKIKKYKPKVDRKKLEK